MLFVSLFRSCFLCIDKLKEISMFAKIDVFIRCFYRHRNILIQTSIFNDIDIFCRCRSTTPVHYIFQVLYLEISYLYSKVKLVQNYLYTTKIFEEHTLPKKKCSLFIPKLRRRYSIAEVSEFLITILFKNNSLCICISKIILFIK